MVGKGVSPYNGSIHWRFGLILWLMLLVGGIWSHPIGALIGSLLPDSDHKKSPMGRIFPLWLIFNHRTWTHTIWGMAVAAGLSYILFGWFFSKGILIGYISHLVLDSCTPSGIYLFGRRKATR